MPVITDQQLNQAITLLVVIQDKDSGRCPSCGRQVRQFGEGGDLPHAEDCVLTDTLLMLSRLQ
jgi:hypothetical protein